MRANKSKSFPLGNNDPFQDYTYSNETNIKRGQEELDHPMITVGEIVNKLFLILQKLFVALKYQFFKKTQMSPNAISIPWFKLIFVALVAFIVFKKDLSFSVNMNAPESLTAKNNMSYNSLATAQPISLTSKETHPFLDKSGDSNKDKKFKSYIRRFQKIAIAESGKFGIPASVKMAQALLESNAGNSRLATNNNNHFGIKCFSKRCKKGHCANFNDDHHKDFFRKYESAWESWRSHSEMIVGGRYKKLLDHGNDYRAWAKGLKKLGYATDKKYTEKLIETIETYRLDLLDTM
ncbi:MAG: glucosaminidase domain-containing protein [Bacteroidetes bacterium]|nr:glucosaminidase domain-containing protein [Bacteroidota bacterium]